MYLGIGLLVVGAILVIIEINSLTFYLLAVAIGCFVAGAVSVYGAGEDFSLGVMGIVTFIGLPVAHWLRAKMKNPEADHITHDDAGNDVKVESFGPDGLRVTYRGSLWSAQMTEGDHGDVRKGDHLRIVRRDGNILKLAPQDVSGRPVGP